MNRVGSARWFSFAVLGTASFGAALTLGGCSGSGSGNTTAGGNFVVVRTDPVNNGRIYLNDPIRIDFSSKVDIDSANLNTVTFQVLDPLGNPVSELVSGTFAVGTSPGDLEPGRRLLFTPHFASDNNFSNGGFRGGRTYLVQMVGGNRINGTAIRDINGKVLEVPTTFSFQTYEGTSPAQLYRNPLPGGPRPDSRGGLEITNGTWDPLAGPEGMFVDVPLNLFGAPPLEIRLNFDQALNPHDGNVPVSLNTDPVVRDQSDRGRIFLEYDDPVYGNDTWIPADVELERNTTDGSTVLLRPVGVLPNNAEIRIIVEANLEDISGESNVGNLAYDRIYATFVSEEAYDQQFNGIVEQFTNREAIDFDAPFPEPMADIGPGYIRAGFDFEGSNTTLEYEPNVLEVVLDTTFTQIVPKNGQPYNVSGGVFNFRNVHIPQGVQVRGQGPNPMVWLVNGEFIVDGHLSVNGGRGARVDTLNSANFAKAGGVGTCGGGNGGPGTPSGTSRDLRGGTGNGPLQVPGLGGGGGRIACTAGCYTGTGYNSQGGGSGGGGGTFATQGDPSFDTATYTGSQFPQKFGKGGYGCSGTSGNRGTTLPGGDAGAHVFTDTRLDNNFWGVGIDLNPSHNIRIQGELNVPVGGGGGGGGGDTAHNTSCNANDPSFANDYSGGGGGGGAGALIIKALGKIEVTATGRISADGGHGGGGEQAGACGEAGGGGAGAGGLVVLMSATKIVIHPHHTGDRYLFRGDSTHPNVNSINKNYEFSISADGGVCTTGTFGGPNLQAKYPNNGANVISGTTYDINPLGGLGGMGIVQLMAPPGDNSDGTNTVLDDNIEVVLPPNPPAGIDKRAILGWRGIPDASGVYRDDFGNVIPSSFGEGDIRPAPTLLPVPYNARSRMRSKWLDSGFSRRELVTSTGDPRAILDNGTNVAGPIYEFAGLDLGVSSVGYVLCRRGEIDASINNDDLEVIPYSDVSSSTASATYLGEPAYQVELASAVLGDVPNRYAQYEAEFETSAGRATLRILSHDADTMLLAPDGQLLPAGITRARVLEKFFKVTVNGNEGLGRTYESPVGSANYIPNANVRIGFAFHQDPSQSTGRYPTDPQEFLYDFEDPGFLNWIQSNGAPGFVQWDVTFDIVYGEGGSVAPGLSPSSPRPAIEYLRIPFRF